MSGFAFHMQLEGTAHTHGHIIPAAKCLACTRRRGKLRSSTALASSSRYWRYTDKQHDTARLLIGITGTKSHTVLLMFRLEWRFALYQRFQNVYDPPGFDRAARVG